MKPYIHTFQTLQNKYFYDVNKNVVVPISNEVFMYLNFILDNKEPSQLSNTANKELANLYKDGYLSSNRIKKFEHPETKYLSDYLSRKLGHLSIQLTQNCNLRCSYCSYTSNNGSNRLHSSSKISFETIRKGLELLRDNSLDKEEIMISFYGGEPLLEFDNIKKAVEFSKKLFSGKKIGFGMTTNGTLFDSEILNFMEDNDFMLTISLDGPKEINDSNRKFSNLTGSVFERVIYWIEHIFLNYSSLRERLGINMVMDPRKDFAEYKQLLIEYPIFNQIRVSATLVDDDHKDDKYEMSTDFRNESNYARFLGYLNIFDEVDFDNNSFYTYVFGPRTSKMLEGFDESEYLDSCYSPSGPCIPGDTKLFLNTEGLFFPCERISETSKINIIGDVANGLDVEKASKILNISKIQFEDCQDCFAIRGCSNCIRSYDNYENDPDSIKRYCELTRAEFRHEIVAKTIIKEVKEI